MTCLYRIRLENTAKYIAVSDLGDEIKMGDDVAIRRDFFLDYGKIISVDEGDLSVAIDTRKVTEPPKIIRKLTLDDRKSVAESRIRSDKALPVIRRHILDLELPMKVLNVMYSLDQKLCTVQFASESRVDFRELLKLLAMSLSSRIDLRQVSVRDEAAAVGGIGCCGQNLCCARFLNDFASINVKMAKDQDISLSSSNISGVCGRLKCCLKYEHETYIELQADMPRRGDTCECAEGCGRVCDRNLLSRRVTINIEEANGSYRNVHCNFDTDQVRVVKGKGAEASPESSGSAKDKKN